MKEALTLLGELSPGDAEWFCSQAHERAVTAETPILEEGQTPEALFFVLEGLVRVHVSGIRNRPLAALGPGELVGEISFLENKPATASVVAAEDSLLLAIPRTVLQSRIDEDPGFAARLYRSFALTATRRLESRVGALSYLLQSHQPIEDASAAGWKALAGELEQFKGLLHRVDRETLKTQGRLSPALGAEVDTAFGRLLDLMNAELGECSPEPRAVRDELGLRVQRELLPYLLLSETAERLYAKPRGYAGDFYSIELIYRNVPAGVGRIGPVVDRCFLGSPVCKALRNRRTLIRDAILEKVNANASAGQRTSLVSLSCGPAAEVLDAYHQLSDPSLLVSTLVEIDAQALAFVGERCHAAGLDPHIHLVTGNLVYLALGRQRLELQEQDLIYSMGLIGSFDDKTAVRLLDYVHQLLRRGGQAIFGTFHPHNVAKPLLDYVVDWRFLHRGEEDLNRLFFQSAFGRPCTNIRLDPEGMVVFAECVKE